MLELCKKDCPLAISSLETCITSRGIEKATMDGHCVASYCENKTANQDCLRSRPSCKAMTDISAPYGIVLTSNVFLNMTICSQFAPGQIRPLDSNGLPPSQETTLISASTKHSQHFFTTILIW